MASELIIVKAVIAFFGVMKNTLRILRKLQQIWINLHIAINFQAAAFTVQVQCNGLHDSLEYTHYAAVPDALLIDPT